jgi:hypothetical protein
MSKSDLPAPTKIIVVSNSNSVEAIKKKDVIELGVGKHGFLWQIGGDASGKP